MHLAQRNRILFTVLLATILSSNALAQKTQVYEQTEEMYYHGVELYNKEVFGPAAEVFERFLELETTPSLMTDKAEVYAMMSHLQLEHRNYDRKLDRYLKNNPQNTLYNLAMLELGNFHFNNRKYRKAAKYYDELDITNLPKEYWEEAHFKMGYSFFKTKDYKQAKSHFNHLRNQQGEYYVEANYFYGYMCYREFKHDCALQSFERIKDKTAPEIMHLYIAQIYYAQKGYKPSLDYLQQHRNDKYKTEYDLLEAKCYFQLKEYDKAKPLFDEIDPLSNYLSDEDIYMMGFTQYRNKNYKKAQESFVRISGLESGLGQLANYQLGQSFLETGDKQKAFLALGVAKRMDFNKEIQEIAHFNYAKLAFVQGATSNAIQSTQEFIRKYPKSEYVDEARGNLAKMLVATNNYNQAIRILEEIKSFDENSKSVYQKVTYNRAEQLFVDKHYDESKTYFNKSLRFPKDKLLQAQAYYWLGEIDFVEKHYRTARSNYSRMLNMSVATKSTYYTKALYSIGYTHYMEQDVNKALNYFSKFDRTAKDKGSAVYNDNALRLGDSYFLKKQYDKAIKAYSGVAGGKYPQSDYAIFQTGIIHGLQKNPTLKVATLRKIETKFPKSVFVDDALYEIGDTYFKYLNKPESALTLFNRIINKYKGSVYVPPSYIRVANIFFNSGDNEKALNYCKKVITDFSNTPSSKEAYHLGESVSNEMGQLDEWFTWIEGKPGSNVSMTYKDSVLYETSLQKYRMGDCEGATKGFTSYLKRFNKSGYFTVQAHYYLAECAYSEDKYDMAVEHYKYVADQSLSEYLEDATYKLAELLYWQKKYTQALPYFSKLERLANTKAHFTSAVVGQMRCNYTLGNMDAAKKNATDVLPIENIETEYLIEANLVLGRIQYNAGNYLTSMFHLDFVVKESTTEEGAEAQYYRCLVLYKQEKTDESRSAVFTLSSDYASYEYWVVKGFILLSDIYVAEKDYFQARA
ncbi:MAG: tetratricopeptide repeat protein, partial [Bacteroidia bacterium]|nr:tetratricopeptide repeat protein [Bacteroidia bacterium]